MNDVIMMTKSAYGVVL